MSTRRKIFFFIPFIIIASLLLYTWSDFIISDDIAILQHYIGLAFFIIILFFLYKDRSLKKPLVLTGIYLVAATFNFLNIFTYTASTLLFRIGSLQISLPGFDILSFLLLLLYGILNFDSLTDIYLDYKERREKH